MTDSVEVLAVDPGGTTGWSLFVIHRDAIMVPDIPVMANILHWSQGQIGGPEHRQISDIIAMVDLWPLAAVVLEDYILKHKRKDRESLSPVRINSAIDWAMREAARPLAQIADIGEREEDYVTVLIEDDMLGARLPLYQDPNMGKSTMTDDRLRDMGYYIREGGEGHARDATRHALTFLKRCKATGSANAVRSAGKLCRAAWPWLYQGGSDDD